MAHLINFFAKLISPKKSDVSLPKKSHQDEIVIHDLRKIDHIPKGTIPFKSKITILIETKNKITSEKLKELKHLDGIPIIVTDERGIRHKKIIHSLKYKKESAFRQIPNAYRYCTLYRGFSKTKIFHAYRQ